jgi:hypothetical protein
VEFQTMKASLLAAGLLLLWPACAWSCGGTAARDISVSFDGQKYTVTNTGREPVQVDFAAFGATYNLQLAPGQSEIPRSPGMFTQPMYGYQSCVATPLAAPSPGVATVRRGP